jgi:hypothetical protein
LSSRDENIALNVSTTLNVWVAILKPAKESLPNPFMEPTPATVATGISRMSKPMGKQKGEEFILNPSPVIDVIRGKGQNIMRAPISSMTFNVKTAIKTSTR